jgi:hydroxymethylpyrimidine pyrophosphatase-like HAD family hydrolase
MITVATGYTPIPPFLFTGGPVGDQRRVNYTWGRSYFPRITPSQQKFPNNNSENELMRYHALACDYDGTLAHNGRVSDDTVAALERLRGSGRRLILVTGRELDDLRQNFSRLDLFERVVAENGALLHCPKERKEKLLAEPPREDFVRLLVERGVGPISVGHTIVATWEPHETKVLETIRDLGLELQVIFNKGAVMVLPSGVNKATGLKAALDELGLSPHNAVGVGDAENDHAFFSLCECSVAVANALPSVKEQADWVTRGDHGAGVIELCEELLRDDLREIEPRLQRHSILLGVRENGDEVRLQPYGVNILIAGPSGVGKSTLAGGFLERLAERGYQFCIIDPEGDYSNFEGAIVLGENRRAPNVDEVLELLNQPSQNVVVNLLGIALDHRPPFFAGLLPRLQELRATRGRPHWTVVDEAHHLLHSEWDPAELTVPQAMRGTLMITVHPESISPAALSVVDLVIAVGEAPERTLANFAQAIGQPPPALTPTELQTGEAIAWFRRTAEPPFWFRSEPQKGERQRHHRKYAEGELGPDLSFYFRGPEGKLKLRAQNLHIFMQLADGVDDETWLHHLRNGDFSEWFRSIIKDDELADEAAQIEQNQGLSARESRDAIRMAIESRYSAPPTGPFSKVGSPNQSS